jgi:hypothetical protein
MCTAVYSLAETPQPPPPTLPPHLGSYTRALLVSPDRRLLFVTTERDARAVSEGGGGGGQVAILRVLAGKEVGGAKSWGSSIRDGGLHLVGHT